MPRVNGALMSIIVWAPLCLTAFGCGDAVQYKVRPANEFATKKLVSK